jgi:hypothetical protein
MKRLWLPKCCDRLAVGVSTRPGRQRYDSDTLRKRTGNRSAFYGAIAALSVVLCLAALPAPTLQGIWKLVEQRYGSGSANLISIEAPLRLEFSVSGGRLVGRIWVAEDRSKALPWPALLTDHGPHPIEVREVSIQPGSNLARTVYRVQPSSPDADALEITEEYRMVEGGTVLLGTVTVTALKKENPAGSYRVHRRFVREP